MAGLADSILALMLDEVWDLSETIRSLEARRDQLRNAILALCRKRGVDRYQHARGKLRVERYSSYKVARPAEVLPILDTLGWSNDVLQVKGRVLHARAALREDTRAYFGSTYSEVRHEVLVLTPHRKR